MKTGSVPEAAAVLFCAGLVLWAMIFSVSSSVSTEKRDAGDGEKKADKAECVNAFSKFKMERESIRSLEILELSKIAGNESMETEIRRRAQEELILLTKHMEAEATIEGVLSLRGHEEAVVTVHSGSVNVVIKSGNANKEEGAFILDLAMRETGQSAGNVKIMTVGES